MSELKRKQSLAAVIPARQAAKLDIVAALRYE